MLRRRLAALAALLLLVAALVVAAVALSGEVLRLIVTLLLIPLAAAGAWFAATRRRGLRVLGFLVAIGAVVGILVLTIVSERHGLLALALVAILGLSALCARYGTRRDRGSVKAAEVPGTPVGPARKGVLIINPKSGGGKGEKFHLVDEARRRGIEPVLLEPGKDLLQLARDAIAGGADVIGMAGGDGSQALVASVAKDHGVAHVCIPAGTRNHFALDLGLDRDDVVGALDAYGDAKERAIDLATVNGRVFVNNASLGVYAKVVQSPEYRDAKAQTAASMLPDLLGPGESAFSVRFRGPDGAEHENAPLVLVSNNPYRLTRLSGFGTRARLDTGELGVTAVEIGTAAEVAAFVAAEAAGQISRYRGFHDWTTSEFRVESDQPVEVGVDGEALVMDAPLVFRSLPGVLRVRIPTHAPGYSPAALAAPSVWWTVSALFRTIAGHPPAIDEHLR
jgi:diacylglycerol kinase family enzyme